MDATQIFALMKQQETTLRPYLSGPEGDALRERLRAMDRDNSGLWLLEQGRKRQPARYDPIAECIATFNEEWSDPALDLYKDWHVLHFVLCGSRKVGDDPLSWAILGRDEVAPGLDDPRVTCLEVAAVFDVATVFETASFDALEAARRDSLAGGVYHWGPDSKEWLRPHFEAVRAYYAGAAEAGLAMLMWTA